MRRMVLAGALLLLAACQNEADRLAPPESGVGGAAPAGRVIDAEIARFLKEGDRGRAEAAEYRALEYGRPGRPETWRNEESGDRGEVVAGPGRTVNALDCRDYAHTAWIEGGRRVARGTACRQSDGSWRVTG